MKKINIFVGHYGSGKTEVSLNYAISLAKEKKEVVLVDLDIVNPFFRSAEVGEMLSEHDIKLIAPRFANTNLDLPALSQEVGGVFNKDNDTYVIFDVGGDPEGARALSRYFPKFKDLEYNMFMVVNTLRPFTNTVDGIIEMAKGIEYNSRLRITHLINNTNLSYETNIDMILRSMDMVEESGKKLLIPIKYITCKRDLCEELTKHYGDKVFPLEIYMVPVWRKDD